MHRDAFTREREKIGKKLFPRKMCEKKRVAKKIYKYISLCSTEYFRAVISSAAVVVGK